MARARTSRPLSVKLSAAAIAGAVAVSVGGGGMSVSAAGVDSIMQWEDCRIAVYRDIAGYPTAGCGHLVTDGTHRVGQQLSKDQIRDLLVEDLAPTVTCVNRGIGNAKTSQGQFDAFVSLTFNIGCPRFLGSTALKCHKRGDAVCATRGIGMWKYAGGKVSQGLINRRAAEAKLYESKSNG